MWRFVQSVLWMAAIILAWYVALSLAGCVFNDPRTGEDCPCHNLTQCKPCAHSEAESWDQANLKRNDHGCPTAIYSAPGGNLVQCD